MAAEFDQTTVKEEEYFDVLTKTGEKTGYSKPRGDVHRDGDYHRAVHVWIIAESTQELLLQRRADCKDSWAGLWDVSSAGHISAGDSSLISARRELQEELGVTLPKDAFELIFVFLQECTINDGKFINNEYNDVYLVTTIDPIPLEAFTLQESEVSAVKYISFEEYRRALAQEHPEYVPYDVNGEYGQLFTILERRYKENAEARSLALEKQLNRYASTSLSAELTGLTAADKEVLNLLVKAATIMDKIFYVQVWYCNPSLRDWLKENAGKSQLDRLKWMYYVINKSPWSLLDENEAFLTTADSAVKLLLKATKPVPGWKGFEYRTAFPTVKPPGANFYPPDMDKTEFNLWKDSLQQDKQEEAMGFFNVVRRHSESVFEDSISQKMGNVTSSPQDLYVVPYSQEYNSLLAEAATLLRKAGDMASSSSLKRLLYSKADAFLSNDYYDSDIAWMELDSKLDITIGPYETYEDALFGYKIAMDEESVPWTTFLVPGGLYEWLVMPFGLKNALATFQRKMDPCFAGMEKFTAVYIDDILVFSDTEEEHAKHLMQVLEVCEKNGLILSENKMKIACSEIEFLGAVFNGGRMKLQPHIVKKICAVKGEDLQTKKGLQSWLGIVNYARPHIKDIGKLLGPLYSKTSPHGDKRFKPSDWALVNKIKELVNNLPDMTIPPKEAHIVLEVDGCMEGCGGVCKWKWKKEDPKNMEQVSAYASGKFPTVKSPVDAEIYACMETMQRLKMYYLDEREITLRTDCEAIVRFYNKTATNKPSRVRWLGFMDYLTRTGVDVHIEHIDGKSNRFADELSRLTTASVLQEQHQQEEAMVILADGEETCHTCH